MSGAVNTGASGAARVRPDRYSIRTAHLRTPQSPQSRTRRALCHQSPGIGQFRRTGTHKALSRGVGVAFDAASVRRTDICLRVAERGLGAVFTEAHCSAHAVLADLPGRTAHACAGIIRAFPVRKRIAGSANSTGRRAFTLHTVCRTGDTSSGTVGICSRRTGLQCTAGGSRAVDALIPRRTCDAVAGHTALFTVPDLSRRTQGAICLSRCA